ncbi:hypothetical protein Xcel_2502 [Xylanimonas cellulosilytica DSM 15894]|uniref:Uncharacterized protein n=1 Tax=Xylanimonas cellulosilytica (strain DSM 15894 / JCM 12276 / CECT 5975 / KCTC 9989 / LMG 20990 / NBRC 107835 / XIL07) TaxID=446471 RepID=D1BWH2_XYLCX|nr:hypothetical protein [Xylanimonas cellulosilytica]ACZ31517.1 hypothetical protein Xcel_2502 [Xylanimonas cellulosilytica DSM 15894]
MAAGARPRWEALFADLEAQFAAHEQAVRDGEVAELTRAEQASIPLGDRLRAVVGAPVGLELLDGEAVAGTLRTVAASWLLIEGRGAHGPTEHLVPIAAIGAVTGLRRQGAPSTSRVDSLGLGTALREVQRDRARVLVRTLGGQAVGRLARVGQDHLDLEEADRAPVTLRTVPFSALLRVSRA